MKQNSNKTEFYLEAISVICMYMHFQAQIFRCFTVFANLRLLVVHFVVKTVSFDRIKPLRFMFLVTFS